MQRLYQNPDDEPRTLAALRLKEREAVREWTHTAISRAIYPSTWQTSLIVKNRLQRETGVYLTTSQFAELMSDAGYALDAKTGTYDIC